MKEIKIILFIFGFSISLNSFACSCKTKTLAEWQKFELNNSEYIFIGNVININESDLTFKIKVVESLNDRQNKGDIYIGKNWKYCSPNVLQTGKWIVYGNMENGYLRLNRCGISRSFDYPIVNPVAPSTKLQHFSVEQIRIQTTKKAGIDLKKELYKLRQKRDRQILKKYNYYVEKNIEMGKWSTKYYLKDGLISIQENYWKNELRSRTEFEYDEFGNVNREIYTYDANEGNVNDVMQIKLEYKNGFLISKKFDYGLTEKYSDFNELGKPKLIESKELLLLKSSSKELVVYDDKGNIIKSTTYTDYKDSDVLPKPENEKSIINYKYDNRNNVIEIHREYEPKQEFPIIMIGGPVLHEFEYFRFKYNKNGLWTKKYKTVNGKEYLVAKRKYK